jgi:hypothetical protein
VLPAFVRGTIHVLDQPSVRMENKHGLTVEFAYTWSHEIDIQSGDLTSSDQKGSGGTLSNPYNPGYGVQARDPDGVLRIRMHTGGWLACCRRLATRSEPMLS